MWDKLEQQYQESHNRLVATVDCTAAGKPLCQKYGVKGYPTLKYGGPPMNSYPVSTLKDYNGDRSYEELLYFVRDKIGPVCDPDHLDICTEKERKFVEKLMNMSASRVNAKVRMLENELMRIDDRWMDFLDENMDKAASARTRREDAIAAQGMDLIMNVKNYRAMLGSKTGKTEL